MISSGLMVDSTTATLTFSTSGPTFASGPTFSRSGSTETNSSSPVSPLTQTPDVRLLVSLATYNERDNLASLIHEIHAVFPTAEILVIDDNSPDGTGRLADELAAADSRIHVIHRPGKLGL